MLIKTAVEMLLKASFEVSNKKKNAKKFNATSQQVTGEYSERNLRLI